MYTALVLRSVTIIIIVLERSIKLGHYNSHKHMLYFRSIPLNSPTISSLHHAVSFDWLSQILTRHRHRSSKLATAGLSSIIQRRCLGRCSCRRNCLSGSIKFRSFTLRTRPCLVHLYRSFMTKPVELLLRWGVHAICMTDRTVTDCLLFQPSIATTFMRRRRG